MPTPTKPTTPTPEQKCLIEILETILSEKIKLNHALNSLGSAIESSWGFIENEDAVRLASRRDLIDGLYREIVLEIALPIPCTYAKNKEEDRKAHVEKLDNERVKGVLEFIYNKATALMDPKNKSRSKLKEHSFSDAWFFNFLSKIVVKIRNALGMKTTSEKLLESAVEKTKQYGANTQQSNQEEPLSQDNTRFRPS